MKGVKTYTKLASVSILSVGLVILVFLLSNHQVHRNNAFTRQYPPHPVNPVFDKDIQFNSYYIAGFDHETLYLGNYTAPLHILQVNLVTQDTVHITLRSKKKIDRYKTLKVSVLPPYFYLMEGTVPFVQRGKIGVWESEAWMDDIAYFHNALPITENELLISTSVGTDVKTVLGKVQEKDSFEVKLHPEILKWQIDGVFDVDGMMVRSGNSSLLGYVYFYRNQFLILDSNLKILRKRNTIDTVQMAEIEVAEIENKKKVQMSAPALRININAAMHHNLMFIQSERLGRNEDRSMLEEAAIIDVYDWELGRYEFSFYLNHGHGDKLKQFTVHNDWLIALMDKRLVVYKLGSLFQKIENTALMGLLHNKSFYRPVAGVRLKTCTKE